MSKNAHFDVIRRFHKITYLIILRRGKSVLKMLFYGKSSNKHETTYYKVLGPVVFTLDSKQLNILCSF